MQETIKNILNNNGIIVLDTNVYLNIYERSPEFSNFSIEVLDSVKDHIMIPSTVKREFKKHHNECFRRQYGRVKNACKELKSQLTSAKMLISKKCNIIKKFKFPDIDSVETEIHNKLDEALGIIDDYDVEHEILKIINDIAISEDNVYKLFSWLVEQGHIFDEMSVDEIYQLSVNGDKRYKDKIPPGYKDDKKSDGISKYGDYFIWEEVIKHAKANSLPVIFVTDDIKNDWFEDKVQRKVFHHKLVEEFNNRVGTDFVGLSSLDFYNYISKIKGIVQTSAITYALNYTTDQYIESLVKENIIYENLDRLLYFNEDYIDISSLSFLGSEGLEVSEIMEATYQNYDIYDISDDSAIYDLRYNIKAKATSKEYWGKDEDTKEVITSPGRIHNLEGEVILRVTREVDPWLISERDSSYIDAELVEGDLKEVSAYDVEELCSVCGKNLGEYQDYYGNPICASCMAINEYGDICTFCGRKVPSDLMYDDRCCIDCAEKHDV
ncbi:MAG: PIN domain-containing protein [Eubacterium sp.]